MYYSFVILLMSMRLIDDASFISDISILVMDLIYFALDLGRWLNFVSFSKESAYFVFSSDDFYLWLCWFWLIFVVLPSDYFGYNLLFSLQFPQVEVLVTIFNLWPFLTYTLSVSWRSHLMWPYPYYYTFHYMLNVHDANERC